MSKKNFDGVGIDTFNEARENEKGSEPGWKPSVTPKKQKTKEKQEFVRVSYYITPLQKESLRIFSYKENKDLSRIIRDFLDASFPEEVVEEAKENLGL